MRIPKINSTFIKKHYKDLGYKKQIEVNKCPIITDWLDKCFELKNSRYIQDELFDFIGSKKVKQ